MEDYINTLTGLSAGIAVGNLIWYTTFYLMRINMDYSLKNPRESSSDLENNLSDDPEILNRK